jgi:hypothetical protein
MLTTCFYSPKMQRATLATQQQRGFKVAVLGAAGGIGQPLSLLLKLNPKVTELSCFDLAPVTPGKMVLCVSSVYPVVVYLLLRQFNR